ncbi:MAG TPA: hypothetical protein VE131_09530 [Terriglobales bacterium]|nr:hypothetical protein [Terriglobales bacterium]
MVRKKRDVEELSGAHRLPVLPCACANLRRAARAVTRLYDQELRGTGLNVTQLTLLQALVEDLNQRMTHKRVDRKGA